MTTYEMRIRDWSSDVRSSDLFTDPVPEKHEHRYREAGILTFHGTAQFTGPNTLRVGDDRLTGRNILIASGAKPIKLGIHGEQHLIDNEGFLALETLPQRIVLVGGGYIAAEFSHIAARAGAQEIGRAHVCTPVTNAPPVCRLLLEKKKKRQ